eukprot:271511-Lingulodinium_polyedra.AAC.1
MPAPPWQSGGSRASEGRPRRANGGFAASASPRRCAYRSGCRSRCRSPGVTGRGPGGTRQLR